MLLNNRRKSLDLEMNLRFFYKFKIEKFFFLFDYNFLRLDNDNLFFKLSKIFNYGSFLHCSRLFFTDKITFIQGNLFLFFFCKEQLNFILSELNSLNILDSVLGLFLKNQFLNINLLSSFLNFKLENLDLLVNLLFVIYEVCVLNLVNLLNKFFLIIEKFKIKI